MRPSDARVEKAREVRGRPVGEVDGREIDPARGALEGEAARVEVKTPEEAWPLHVPPHIGADTRARGATYYGLPMLKEPVWKGWIPTYFFLGGAAGASLAIAGAAQIVGGRDRGLRALVTRGRWVGAAGCALGSALLVADLGRPARFLKMLRVVRATSPMSVGAWILAACGAASGGAALFGRSALGDVAGCAAALAGFPLAGYTAVLLSTTAVPVWNARVALPVLFVGSAMTSGAAILELLPPASARERRALRVFGALGAVAELAGGLAVERELGGDVVRRPLREGSAALLWKAARGLTAASLAVALVPRAPRPLRAAGAALGLAGALAVRFAITRAGVKSSRDPDASFAPQRARRASRSGGRGPEDDDDGAWGFAEGAPVSAPRGEG